MVETILDFCYLQILYILMYKQEHRKIFVYMGQTSCLRMIVCQFMNFPIIGIVIHLIINTIKPMHSNTAPNSHILLQQLISESGITSKQEKMSLKHQFRKKLSQHINIVQYHHLREDRFILSQKKVLEKQNLSIQKTKEYLDLRQRKANLNKIISLKDKSKRMESELDKWERIVEKKRQEEELRLRQSQDRIKDWNEKLSESTSRKKMALVEFTKNLKEKSQEKEKKVLTHRLQSSQEKMRNPEEYQRLQEFRRERYIESVNQKDIRRSSRVSTQSIFDKRKKKEEDDLERSLISTVNKQEKINEARHLKMYLQQRKKKQRMEKEENIRRMRENNLNYLKNAIEERNHLLDEKYQNSRVKVRNKSSLPQIKGSKTDNLLSDCIGEEWRHKDKPHSYIDLDICTSKNYDRLIMDKLKDVSMIMRKKRLA